jgi:pentatricopeptide repeat protein
LKELEANLVIYNTIISSYAVAGAWLKAAEVLEASPARQGP